MIFAILGSDAARHLAACGITLFAQSTVLFVGALIACQLLRKRGPAVQAAITKGALTAFLVLIVVAVIAGDRRAVWQVSPPQNSGGSYLARLLAGVADSSALEGSIGTSAVSSNSHAGVSYVAALDGASLGLVVWFGGALILVAVTARSVRRLNEIRLAARPDTALSGDLIPLARIMRAPAVDVLASPDVPGPILVGLLRPAIILPSDYRTQFHPEALRAILAHELTHANNHDCAWNLLARIVCAIGWFQPLVWVVVRRMEQAGEEVCDESVLLHTCPPKVYAECLLRLAERWTPNSRQTASALGVVGFRSSLGRRVEKIMKADAISGPVTRRMKVGLVVGLATFAVAGLGLFAVGSPRSNRSLTSAETNGLPFNASMQGDASTPKGAIQAFVAALGRADVDAAAKLVVGASAKNIPAEFVAHWKEHHAVVSANNLIAEIDGDKAIVAVEVTIKENSNSAETYHEKVHMIKGEDGWKIVPATPELIQKHLSEKKSLIEPLAGLLAHPDAFQGARQAATASICESHLKQLGIGLTMLAADHKDTYAVTSKNWESKIRPYVGNMDALFKCPGVQSGASYSINQNVIGKTLINLKAPSETVLLYEGSDGKLDFRHDGKAGITYVDGHISMVNPDQAKKLRWKP